MVCFAKSQKETMEVQMPDGEVLHILPPAKRLMSQMVQSGKTIDELYSLAMEVLGNNREERQIAPEQVEELGLDDIRRLMSGYLSFINAIQSNPN